MSIPAVALPCGQGGLELGQIGRGLGVVCGALGDTFARVEDRGVVTPTEGGSDLVERVVCELARQVDEGAGATELLLIDLGRRKNRLGASALAQVYEQVGAVPLDLDEPAREGNRSIQRCRGHAIRAARPAETRSSTERPYRDATEV